MKKVLKTLVILVIIVSVFYVGRNFDTLFSRTPVTTEDSQKPAPNPPTQPSEKGTIEGSILFPSEFIPNDLMICAENIQTKTTTCTQNQIEDEKYQYNKGFKLAVEPGAYLVYAQQPDQEYKAYYSEFVVCGLSIDCNDHTPISVEVEAGETVKAEPHDWYNIPIED